MKSRPPTFHPSAPVAGTTATYTLTVTNSGPSDAQGVWLTDSLPAGTALVWVLWPERQRIDVWHRDGRAPVVTLTPGDALDGRDGLPGFTHPVADICA